MPDFNYKARNKSGKEVSGQIAANTKKDVLDILARQNLYPISVEDVNKGEIDLGKWFARRPPDSVVAAFLQQLAELLNNGVPVLAAFQVLEKQEQNPTLKEVIGDIYERVSEGEGIDVAFAAHPKIFNDLTLSIIQAGTEGAFLEDSLKRTARFMEQQAELKGKIISAMIYPTILCVVGVIVLTVLMVFFVPKFQPIFDSILDNDGQLPGATVVLLGLKRIVGKYGFYILIALGALAVYLRFLTMTKGGRRLFDRWKLKIPLLGPIVLGSAVSRFCRVLGTLLENGVPILRALEISSRSTGNTLLEEAIEKSADSVSSGEPLSKPLAESDLLPPQVMAMITVAEESNSLETVLVNIADSIEREIAKKLDVLVSLLEPMMLLSLAGGVFFIIIGLLLPVFKMTENI
ncbi:MAG: type II secretion system F family protein [Thermoguttaceae bacterium]|jgi:type II secretory pathway component PulF